MPKTDTGMHVTNRQFDALALKTAHGSAHVLAVGVGENLAISGFQSLKTCNADAAAVWATFKETRQLNVDPDKLYELTTTTRDKPTRGTILAKLKELSQGAGIQDRIVFFFSGHGCRIEKNLYLVPSDAYDADDPESLLGFEKVVEILNSSEAKQKIVILDACFSGPDTTHLKFGLQPLSVKFLTEYLSKTQGVVVLSSSGSNQASSIKSPNPNLSLFTHFLVKGLRGDAAALQGQYLTVPSLFAYLSCQVNVVSKSHGIIQTPGLSMNANGIIMLADFTPRILSDNEIDLGESPVACLEFEDGDSQDVQEILTYIKNWGYSVEWIEKTANGALGEFVKELLGVKKVALRKAMDWNPGDVVIEDTGLLFPSGSYSMMYRAKDKKHGLLVHVVSFNPEWFGRSDDILKILAALEISPKSMTFTLINICNPISMVPGLEASGWVISSELEDKVIAKRDGGYSLNITHNKVVFGGLAPRDIFGAAAHRAKTHIAMSVLVLLPQ